MKIYIAFVVLVIVNLRSVLSDVPKPEHEATNSEASSSENGSSQEKSASEDSKANTEETSDSKTVESQTAELKTAETVTPIDKNIQKTGNESKDNPAVVNTEKIADKSQEKTVDDKVVKRSPDFYAQPKKVTNELKTSNETRDENKLGPIEDIVTVEPSSAESIDSDKHEYLEDFKTATEEDFVPKEEQNSEETSNRDYERSGPSTIASDESVETEVDFKSDDTPEPVGTRRMMGFTPPFEQKSPTNDPVNVPLNIPNNLQYNVLNSIPNNLPNTIPNKVPNNVPNNNNNLNGYIFGDRRNDLLSLRRLIYPQLLQSRQGTPNYTPIKNFASVSQPADESISRSFDFYNALEKSKNAYPYRMKQPTPPANQNYQGLPRLFSSDGDYSRYYPYSRTYFRPYENPYNFANLGAYTLNSRERRLAAPEKDFGYQKFSPYAYGFGNKK